MRKTIVALVILITWSLGAQAQERGEQTPPPAPAPAPQPNPQPRFPLPVPDRPQPGTEQRLNISGRLIADARLPERTIEVRLEGQSAERVAFAYTDGAGEFMFRSVSLNSDQYYYVVATVEGYKPIRERLDVGRDLAFAPRLTIFLEREAAIVTTDGQGGNVVGVRQLAAKIPGKALDEYKKALKDTASGNHKKAIERLELAVKLAPDFYEAQNNLGSQYLRAKRFDEAQKAFESARNLNPQAAEPLVNLGSLHYQQGEMQSGTADGDAAAEFEKAVELLGDAIRRNPTLAPAHHYLGAALYKTGDFEQAESTLRRALELDSELAEAGLMLVNVYTRQNRFEEALQQINTYLEKNPKAPQRAPLEKIKQQIESLLNR